MIGVFILDQKKANKIVLYKLIQHYRSVIQCALVKKDSIFIVELGCTVGDFKKHIESQFESWMSWENRGNCNNTENETWHIDHIIPIGTAKCEEEILKLTHFSNLRPLCSLKNLKRKKS